MPKKAEAALRRTARKKGFTGERFRKYVYGGLRAIGWVPSHQKKKLKRRKKHGN